MPPVDPYADDMKPTLSMDSVTFKVEMPGQEKTWAILTVETNAEWPMVTAEKWCWFGQREPRSYSTSEGTWHLLETRKEVFEWLTEWEIIELRNIGPEDAEYFATESTMEFINGRNR